MKRITLKAITDDEMRRSIIISTFLALFLPPFLGGSLMGLVGFYPMPEFYLIFTDIAVLMYIGSACLISSVLIKKSFRYIKNLTLMDASEAQARVQKTFKKLPWILYGLVALYSIGGVLSADLSMERMHYRHYTFRDHLYNQFGIIPVVLITTFPIFFFFVDRLGRYLGPRGIFGRAIPLWMKLLMLGIVTPLLIDSLLIGYFLNRTGYFEWQTLVLWLSLVALAGGGAWLAWRSLRQGMAPLEAFISSSSLSIVDRTRNLTPFSLDELGILTSRFADILKSRENLFDDLMRAESLANAVINNAGALVLVLDSEGRIMRFNHASENLSGYTFSEVKGKFPWDTLLRPEDADIIRRDAFEILAKDPMQLSGNYTNYWKSKSGRLYMIDWYNTVLIGEGGRMEAIVSVGIDVTERSRTLEALKENEAELKRINESLEVRVLERTKELEFQNRRNEMILNTTLDGFFAADASGSIVVANPSFCEMLNYTHGEILSKKLADIEANEKPEDIAAHMEKILITGHDRFDTRHRRKDGSLVNLEISVNLVEIGEEKLFYAFTRDITARLESEAALKRSKEEAEKANLAKSEFLSRMSHELRTPMNAIIGFAQVLKKEAISPDGADYVNEIYTAGIHLLQLINELLDLSRIESGKLAVVLEPVPVRSAVIEAVGIVNQQIQEKKISLINRCDSDVVVLSDKIRFKQILLNLFSNAVKYNRQGGRIEVDCGYTDEKRLRLNVSDTGPGIDPEKQTKIFSPFERLGAEFTDVQGTGIGLALSKQLAELMSGEMGLDSDPGSGSTFWIELPAAEKSAVMPLVSDENEEENMSDQYRILHVEDNSANLRVIEAMFKHRPGLKLISAVNGEFGLKLAQDYLPDAILLDIHLPGMDGYALLKALKADERTCNIPVIAISADAMPIDIEKGMKAGFKEYLTKPIDEELLFKTLERFLMRK